MCDPHHVVVNHCRQVIERPSVSLQDDGIFQLFVIDGDISAKHVMYDSRPFMRYFETDYMRLSRCYTPFGFFKRNVAAMAVIMRKFIVGCLLVTHFFQPFGCAETIVSVALLNQLFGNLLVDLFSFSLPVWTVRPADVRTFIPFNTQPVKSVDDLLLSGRNVAGPIRIFDTQNELTACFFRDQVIIKSRPGSTQMQSPGRGWRKTDTCGF